MTEVCHLVGSLNFPQQYCLESSGPTLLELCQFYCCNFASFEDNAVCIFEDNAECIFETARYVLRQIMNGVLFGDYHALIKPFGEQQSPVNVSCSTPALHEKRVSSSVKHPMSYSGTWYCLHVCVDPKHFTAVK